MRQMTDSGIAWIGEIPEGWKLDTIGNLYSLRQEKVSDKDYQPLSVSKMGVVPQLENAAKTDDGDNRKLVRVGDFAINSRSDRRGSCGISAYDGSVSLINTIITPRTEMCPQYYNWLFHTELFADEFYKWGHGIVDDLWTTRWQEMKRISIVLPSLPEQKAIADFLDTKCAEIDELTAIQEKFIDELKAYKQSLITETVTHGLNPHAPMTDSGVEWIGQIPEGWEVRRLKQYYAFEKGKNAALYTADYVGLHIGSYPVYSGQTENNGVMGRIDTYDYDVDECLFTTTVGAKVMTPKVLRGKFSLSQNCLIMKPLTSETNNTYTFYLLHKIFEYAKSQIPTYMQPSLRVEDLKTYMYILPPLPEQQSIAVFLDEKCAEIDQLIAIKQQKIDELRDYKKSLIYEYVTGIKEVS